jgi:hypothetical protein
MGGGEAKVSQIVPEGEVGQGILGDVINEQVFLLF